MRILFRWFSWPFIVLVVLVWVLLGPDFFSPKPSGYPHKMVASAPIGGAFDLVDQNGRSVTDQDYKTPYKLIFFGFTACPSICPSELLKMGDILTTLGSRANRVTPLFITVDPARDTPQILKTYTAKFDPRITGLTGTSDQVDRVLQKFRVYAARVDTPHGYTMDHSAFLYLTDAKNQMITIYKIDQTADVIAADLRKRMD